MDTLIRPHAETTAAVGMLWMIDPANTSIGFSIRHMVFATAQGHFRTFRGMLQIDDEFPSNSFVEVQIEVDSIDTGEKRRDDHLRSSDFFDVATYPRITFRSTRVELTTAGRHLYWTVVGDLTIHGMTRQVELAVEQTGNDDPWATDVRSFVATTTINRKDFAIGTTLSLTSGGLAIGDEVNISIDVRAVNRPV